MQHRENDGFIFHFQRIPYRPYCKALILRNHVGLAAYRNIINQFFLNRLYRKIRYAAFSVVHFNSIPNNCSSDLSSFNSAAQCNSPCGDNKMPILFSALKFLVKLTFKPHYIAASSSLLKPHHTTEGGETCSNGCSALLFMEFL